MKSFACKAARHLSLFNALTEALTLTGQTYSQVLNVQSVTLHATLPSASAA